MVGQLVLGDAVPGQLVDQTLVPSGVCAELGILARVGHLHERLVQARSTWVSARAPKTMPLLSAGSRSPRPSPMSWAAMC